MCRLETYLKTITTKWVFYLQRIFQALHFRRPRVPHIVKYKNGAFVPLFIGICIIHGAGKTTIFELPQFGNALNNLLHEKSG